MYKNIFLIIACLACLAKTNAQVTTQLLQTLDTPYQDLKASPDGNYLVGLRFENSSMSQRVDLRTFTDSSFGYIQFDLPLDNDVYWDRLEVTDSFAYALSEFIQPVHILSPQSAIAYGRQPLCNILLHHQRWQELIFALSADSLQLNRLYIHSLANPFVPQVLDTVDMPRCLAMKVLDNRMFFLTGDSSGLRMRIYTLTSTAPYLTLNNTIVLNTAISIYGGNIDHSGSQLVVHAVDTSYFFRIHPTGLTLLSKTWQPYIGHPVIIDTNTISYMGVDMHLRDVVADTIFTIDSLTTFDGYLVSSMVGSNLFYASSQKSWLRRVIRETPTSVGPALPAQDIDAYPNPAQQSWTINNRHAGSPLSLSLYSMNGKLLLQQQLHDGINKISLETFASGTYFYTIRGNKGTSSGRLVKQ
jgi:hypothetical protein